MYLKEVFLSLRDIWEDFKEIEDFRHLFLISSMVFGILGSLVLVILGFDKIIVGIYNSIYIAFVYLTFYFIVKISEVNLKIRFKKFDVLKYLLIFVMIFVIYIFLFAYLFFMTFLLNKGFLLSNEELEILTLKESLFFSGMSFVSYDLGYSPIGWMKFFLFFEVFASQIIIVGFAFIVFGQFLSKIKRKKDAHLLNFRREILKIKGIGDKTADKIIEVYKEDK